MFMNEYEIDEAAEKYRGCGANEDAANALKRFKDFVNNHSDGWPYWRAARGASRQLVALVQTGTATATSLRKALSPIKALCTKHRLNYQEMETP